MTDWLDDRFIYVLKKSYQEGKNIVEVAINEDF